MNLPAPTPKRLPIGPARENFAIYELPTRQQVPGRALLLGRRLLLDLTRNTVPGQLRPREGVPAHGPRGPARLYSLKVTEAAEQRTCS